MQILEEQTRPPPFWGEEIVGIEFVSSSPRSAQLTHIIRVYPNKDADNGNKVNQSILTSSTTKPSKTCIQAAPYLTGWL